MIETGEYPTVRLTPTGREAARDSVQFLETTNQATRLENIKIVEI